MRKQINIPKNPVAYAIMLEQFLFGITILFITKEVMRFISYRLVPKIVQMLNIAPAHVSGVANNRRYVTEIPCICIMYSTFTFACLGSQRYFKYLPF